MNIAIIIGRKGSIGFPGKNIINVLGRKMCEYPIIHSLNSKFIDKIYLSTDDPSIIDIGLKYGIVNIERPPHLCTKEALGEDVFVHALKQIKNREKINIQFIALLFCNAVTFLAKHIDEGMIILKNNLDADSAVTVSKLNWYSPVRARRIDQNGMLQPFIPFENYPPMMINCDRDAQGDVYFADVCVSVIRPHCLENIQDGILPQKWMGKRIYPIQNFGSLDIDEEWQLPLVENWLKMNGFSEEKTPYEK